MQNLTYVKTLPMINSTDKFLVLEDAYTDLSKDWLAYIDVMLDYAFQKNSKFKTIRKNIGERKTIFSINGKGKNILGIGSKFSVVDTYINNGKIEIKPVLGYPELVEMYFSSDNPKVCGLTTRSIIDRFFAYQWSKQKLLFPVTKTPPNYQRPENWNLLMKGTVVTSMLEEWFDKKDNVSLGIKYRKQAINSVISSTCWYTPDQITEENLSLAQELVSSGGVDGSNQRRSLLHHILVFNELRYMLINEGRSDIKSPRDISKLKRGKDYDEKGKQINRFAWVDIKKYPNFSPLVSFADNYMDRLEFDGLSVGTISGYATAINNLFRYFLKYYPYHDIDIDLVDEIFDPKNDNTFFTYLRQSKEKAGAAAEINKVVAFFVFSDLFSKKARKNIPKVRVNTKKVPYRNAMPKDMVADIVDILKNRPPKSTTKWNKELADSSWWKFDVYPVYPIMMLTQYYIPLRGEQIRYLCRQNSFVFNREGKIETIVINTDKNTKRKFLHEVPCVWDDLQVFVPFLNWHKKYYKHIPKVIYHNDPNSPWENIEPLMITPKSLTPMSRATHFNYHKKVLCKYQLEKMMAAKKNGKDDYPVVAWSKADEPFFETFEEIDDASSKRMGKIEVMYDIHAIRVTGATRYLEAGVGLKTVMDLTGHANSNMLLQIYIQLTREEKESKLKSAVDKIFFGRKENIIENSKDLIKGEMVRAFNKGKDETAQALEDNALISLNRKASSSNSQQSLDKGTTIALTKHPSSWMPMIHGICPGVKCPEGRENKCSLCPYLITGKLFMDGVVHQSNRAIIEFQRLSTELHEEEEVGYQNQAKMEFIETKLEEIFGWQEILERIEDQLSMSELEKEEHLSQVQEKAKSVFRSDLVSTDIAYLHHAYDAQLMGVEKDRMGLKVLTIKAMKLAMSLNNKIGFELVSSNENEVIDLLMQYYHKNNTLENNGKEFIASLNSLPKPV